MPNNAPAEPKIPPTLAQIYEKTYCDELAKETPDMKARILAGKDSNKQDRLVLEWIQRVSSKAEVEYDILTTVAVPQVKSDVDVPTKTEAAPIK